MWCWIKENYEIIAAFGTLLTAIFTLIIAIVTGLAAKYTQKSSQANILIKFMDEYRSIKMLNSLNYLRRWRDDNPTIYNQFTELLKTDYHEEMNEARRFVKTYFLNALELYINDFVNDAFMKAICQHKGIEILFEIVEPLEYSLAEYLEMARKSETEIDTYQYKENLEPDFKIKFDMLRALSIKYQK